MCSSSTYKQNRNCQTKTHRNQQSHVVDEKKNKIKLTKTLNYNNYK